MKEHIIPARKDVPKADKWDLSSLYKTEDDWEKELRRIPEIAAELASYQGKLAENAETMLKALQLLSRLEQISETAGSYAFLLTAADGADSGNQDKYGRYMMCAADAEAKTSFMAPEIQSISAKEIETRLSRADYADFRVYLKKLLRLKPYILSGSEEKILAMQAESNAAVYKAFSMLTNVDIDFGTVNTSGGTAPLSQSTFSVFLEDSDRAVRKEAYAKFYKAFDAHKNTLSALYAGSVNLDIYQARVRGYSSARQMALFPDNVPESVYDNLTAAVRSNFAPLHKYYALKKRVLNVDTLRHYDVYAPLVSDLKKHTTFAQAVEIIHQALSPLGTEYTDTLCSGLLGGWVDKYENKGKRSGAFSSGAYTGFPYILINYKDDSLRDVFTLAHEGGHSMHSLYSARSNPFMHYNYTIFEAEVASTFNEELVFRFLLEHAGSKAERAYLLSSRAGDILATLYRQTMFAEYEQKTHELVENGTPLSLDVLRSVYQELLTAYFGPNLVFEPESSLECLRIPHFYNAFYVYKYATGISAALALADRVLNGGAQERNDYFAFLKSGGSRYPLESLKVAGIDMSKTAPIQSAIDRFSIIVDELDTILE
ncbi:MAG: oligoendopeptidase F [Bacteroides sp.]|nr:oligoendopeptidase F [Prevotella sp.]MCM1407574.1 oligoendopeptidase F [Treponema brennaborense]MCM1469276.1 oligoendopeptidase F [Bacteroides sp.]